MTKTFKIGDRVVDRDGGRADVVAVSKDGKRIKIEFWSRGVVTKLQRMWVWADAYEPFRAAA